MHNKKIVLITGAGSGLGEELARCYCEEGKHIVLVGRNKEKLRNVAEIINKLGGSADCVTCDISNYDSVKSLVEYISGKYKSIDYLINNAGIGYFGPLEKITIEEVNAMLDVNVKGTIIVTQGLIPYVKDRILNIISTAGLRGKINESVYAASKYAIRGFTESLQKEFADKNLKITAVYMGGMDTPFWENSTHIKDKSRLRSPESVAREIKAKDDGREEIHIE
ncbi:SDR family NAD(P)-dependent oxidoreductase [Clostridium bovifaecis]|uniref:SDR family NAD(P)-dependent oxidoreductase n=1 Tax=Clostridium bovifaecis TaxID=2184719 RepID=A0A6I6ESU2_9CLOT|nr:SDR family NAD(P)-dependent oxidoreductase [Clostridium bovifaecis]